MSTVDQVVYCLFDLFKRRCQGKWNWLQAVGGGKEPAKDASIELGEEEGYLQAIGGQLIAIRIGNAPNHTPFAQAP
jgi:hypothetical protein